MYEPLGVDPLPPGPLINNPAAPLLRLLLRAFNVALAALGLLLIAASLWMGQEYRGSDDGDSGGGDSGGDDLSSSGGGSGGFGGGGAAAGVASFPWFIYATGVVGAYCFATALCGLAGVTRQRRRQLALYLLLLALLVVAQAGATVLLLTDNAWRQHIPDDPSGRWRQAQAWLAQNAHCTRLAAVAALFAELAALAAASYLHHIYTSAWEAWEDDREEQTERAREALHRAVVATYAGSGSGTWSSRLRSKYGVEASALEAATNAARQTAALKPDSA